MNTETTTTTTTDPPPPLAPSVEKAYYRKCIALKRRLNEVESANDAAKLRRLRLDRAIMKMRLERAFLLDELRRRMEGNGDGSEGSGEEGVVTPPVKERPLRDKRRRGGSGSAVQGQGQIGGQYATPGQGRGGVEEEGGSGMVPPPPQQNHVSMEEGRQYQSEQQQQRYTPGQGQAPSSQHHHQQQQQQQTIQHGSPFAPTPQPPTNGLPSARSSRVNSMEMSAPPSVAATAAQTTVDNGEEGGGGGVAAVERED